MRKEQNLIEFSKLVRRNLFEVNHQVQVLDTGKLQLFVGETRHPKSAILTPFQQIVTAC